MDITTDQDIRLLLWAAERLQVQPWNPDQVRWIAGWSDAGPVFVVIYSRFSDRNCELTIATDGTRRWATRKALKAIFTVPFRQWGLRRVSFIVRADNQASIDLCQRLGAVREGVVRKTFPGDVDGVVLGMLAEECLWTA